MTGLYLEWAGLFRVAFLPPSPVCVLPAVLDLTINAMLTPGGLGALVAAAASACAGLLLLLAPRRLRGSTLMAAWWWSLVAMSGMTLAALVTAGDASWSGGRAPSVATAAIRLAAAMLTFCPLMAVLGAKRPQHRAWQFIVLSLWCILTLPAGQALLFGSSVAVHTAQGWFLLILILVGVANYLPTRFWLESLLWGAAEIMICRAYLPLPEAWLGHDSRLGGHAAWGPGLLFASVALGTLLRAPRRAGVGPVDRAWLDFRDAYGAVWALRIMERVNASAVQNSWPWMLSWVGFVARAPTGATLDVGATPIADNLRSLLRRFLGPEWLRVDSRQSRIERPNERSPS